MINIIMKLVLPIFDSRAKYIYKIPVMWRGTHNGKHPSLFRINFFRLEMIHSIHKLMIGRQFIFRFFSFYYSRFSIKNLQVLRHV